MPFGLSSPKFRDHGEIPSAYTAEGSDTSPPLVWSDEPPGTKSYALVVDDPDAPDPAAPKRTWVHWVVYDLPKDVHELPEGASGRLPGAAREGKNDWGAAHWGGPNPPKGRHRYFFKLYALDTELPPLDGATKKDLERAMDGHVLAKAELVGTYEKRR